MPTYTNSLEVEVIATTPYTKFASEAVVVTDYYIKNPPAGITLTSHTPQTSPWSLLTQDENDQVAVANFDYFIIHNASEAPATLSANTDDDNYITVPAGTREVYDNRKCKFGLLTVLGGAINIYGGVGKWISY